MRTQCHLKAAHVIAGLDIGRYANQHHERTVLERDRNIGTVDPSVAQQETLYSDCHYCRTGDTIIIVWRNPSLQILI